MSWDAAYKKSLDAARAKSDEPLVKKDKRARSRREDRAADGTTHKKRGRPYKSSPIQRRRPSSSRKTNSLGQEIEKLGVEIMVENKRWLQKQAVAHWSCIGQVLDDIICALRAGEKVEIKTYTPKFVIKAKKAEMKRRARLEGLEKKARAEAKQTTPDDGSEVEF